MEVRIFSKPYGERRVKTTWVCDRCRRPFWTKFLYGRLYNLATSKAEHELQRDVRKHHLHLFDRLGEYESIPHPGTDTPDALLAFAQDLPRPFDDSRICKIADGGLVSSTLMTLFVIPVVYETVESLRSRLRR